MARPYRSKSIWKMFLTKKKLSDEFTADVTATGSMPNTVGTMPIYDEAGNTLGYVALYANADLS